MIVQIIKAAQRPPIEGDDQIGTAMRQTPLTGMREPPFALMGPDPRDEAVERCDRPAD